MACLNARFDEEEQKEVDPLTLLPLDPRRTVSIAVEGNSFCYDVYSILQHFTEQKRRGARFSIPETRQEISYDVYSELITLAVRLLPTLQGELSSEEYARLRGIALDAFPSIYVITEGEALTPYLFTDANEAEQFVSRRASGAVFALPLTNDPELTDLLYPEGLPAPVFALRGQGFIMPPPAGVMRRNSPPPPVVRERGGLVDQVNQEREREIAQEVLEELEEEYREDLHARGYLEAEPVEDLIADDFRELFTEGTLAYFFEGGEGQVYYVAYSQPNGQWEIIDPNYGTVLSVSDRQSLDPILLAQIERWITLLNNQRENGRTSPPPRVRNVRRVPINPENSRRQLQF